MNPPTTKVNWRARYLEEVGASEQVLSTVANGVFTIWSFLLHAVVYSFAWVVEGGDHHLFLDIISMEAVFVSLCVGINTKLQAKAEKVAQQQRDHLQEATETEIRQNTKITEEVRDLTHSVASMQDRLMAVTNPTKEEEEALAIIQSLPTKLEALSAKRASPRKKSTKTQKEKK